MNLSALTQLLDTWNSKALADMRKEALAEKTGFIYDAFRVENGPRIVLVLCVTDVEAIRMLERVFDFNDAGRQDEDWSKLTVGAVVSRTMNGAGLNFEAQRDPSGRRIALVLCATDQPIVQKLSKAFNLPE